MHRPAQPTAWIARFLLATEGMPDIHGGSRSTKKAFPVHKQLASLIAIKGFWP